MLKKYTVYGCKKLSAGSFSYGLVPGGFPPGFFNFTKSHQLQSRGAILCLELPVTGVQQKEYGGTPTSSQREQMKA
jgi:hypothetical protein